MNDLKLYSTAGLFGALYAAILSTEQGKQWIDEYTTAGVVLGVSGVLFALRSSLPGSAWRRTVGAFVAAGLPLVVRGIVRRVEDATCLGEESRGIDMAIKMRATS